MASVDEVQEQCLHILWRIHRESLLHLFYHLNITIHAQYIDVFCRSYTISTAGADIFPCTAWFFLRGIIPSRTAPIAIPSPLL